MKEKQLLLEMHNIHASYSGTKALSGVDFNLYRGEIHALAGEHRAGKSTLVNLLGGAIRKEAGTFFFKGNEISFFTPQSAMKRGVGMVYQNINLIPSLSALENIFIGQKVRYQVGSPNRAELINQVNEILTKLNIHLDIDVPIQSLSLGHQHLIELARILLLKPDLIVLDELSNKLTPDEIAPVYQLLFQYKREGKGIIYITHNMDEILQLADRVTVLKNGYRLGTEYISDLNKYKLIEMTYSYALDKEKMWVKSNRFGVIKNYIESILQNLPMGVLIVDNHLHIQIYNFVALDILELEKTQFANENFEKAFTNIDLLLRNEIRIAIQDKETTSWKDIKLTNKNKVVSIFVFPFLDQSADPIGSVILIRDVLLDHALKEYLIQSEKMSSVAEVAVGVAHEINNPLYIIKNYVDLLKRQDIDMKANTRLSKIDVELNRIVEIVNSLLSFSRMKQSPVSRHNINDIISETLMLLDFQIQKKMITVETHFEPNEILADVIENKIKQVLLNLISNSVEAILEKGKIMISTYFNALKSEVEIKISDNGCGIPQNIRENVFNPFFSTKLHKKNTGLGLSICKHIIEEHGGRIHLQSNAASSNLTTFNVVLPCQHNHLNNSNYQYDKFS